MSREYDAGNLNLVPFPAKPDNGLPIQSSFQARAIYENIPRQIYWNPGI